MAKIDRKTSDSLDSSSVMPKPSPLQAYFKPPSRSWIGIIPRVSGLQRALNQEGDAVQLRVNFVLLATGSFADGKVPGRHGETMEGQWKDGLATLHGMMTSDLPNLLFTGHNQAGVCANQMYVLLKQSAQAAFILAEAARRAGRIEGKGDGKGIVFEPTVEGEETWALEVLSRIATQSGAALLGCSPGYYHGEGGLSKLHELQLEQMKMARLANWGGIACYIEWLENWQS